MNRIESSVPTALGVVLLTIGLSASWAGANTSSSSGATAAEESASQTEPSERPALDGAKVYAWNCGSCHSERWPKERSDQEWDVITKHMRVRANLTAEQTEAVLNYLKENN